jgi:hypothetical protein
MTIWPKFTLAFFLFLTACATTPPVDLVSTKNVVIVPSDKIMVCQMHALPKKFLSNKDVALSYVRVYSDGMKCQNNMNAVKKFLTDTQKTVN